MLTLSLISLAFNKFGFFYNNLLLAQKYELISFLNPLYPQFQMIMQNKKSIKKKKWIEILI